MTMEWELAKQRSGVTDETFRTVQSALGLTDAQMQTKTATSLIRYFTSEEGKALALDEAKAQVSAMAILALSLKREHEKTIKEIENLREAFRAIMEVEEKKEEYKVEAMDDRAKNAIIMFSTMLSMSKKQGCDGAESVKNASYCVYAYLGGQAKRDICYVDSK